MSTDYTTIPVTRQTLADLRARKRGGETYDALIQKMTQAYDREGGPT